MRAWEASGVAGGLWWAGTSLLLLAFGVLGAFFLLTFVSNDFAILLLFGIGWMLAAVGLPLWGLAAVAAAFGRGRLDRPLLLLLAIVLVPTTLLAGLSLGSTSERLVVATVFAGGLAGCIAVVAAVLRTRRPSRP